MAAKEWPRRPVLAWSSVAIEQFTPGSARLRFFCVRPTVLLAGPRWPLRIFPSGRGCPIPHPAQGSYRLESALNDPLDDPVDFEFPPSHESRHPLTG